VRRLTAPILVLTALCGCSHPIDIVGQGDVLSASGDRDCLLEEHRKHSEDCTLNYIMAEYVETYSAIPRPGWRFDRWGNYCTDSNEPTCSFDVPAEIVEASWGVVAEPLVAYFKRDECIPASTPDPYSPTSYDSCNVPDEDLTGLWMLVSDYSVKFGTWTERILRQRSTMTITRQDNNTLVAEVCNILQEEIGYEEKPSKFLVEVGSDELLLYDASVRADMTLNVVNNVRLEGHHIDTDDTTVTYSTITGIKLSDSGTLSPGTSNIAYVIDGDLYQKTAGQVECFFQSDGLVQFTGVDVKFDGRFLVGSTEVDSSIGSQLATVTVFLPDGEPRGNLEIDLYLADAENIISGEDNGNTHAEYLRDNRDEILLRADARDDIDPSKTLDIEFNLGW
jgi:hypothetical protein